MKFEGKVIKYGDNVDTDVIIPARYLNTIDKKELASHCMEDLDTTFASRVQAGDIMVAGWNFGCGSSREHAPIAIKESGMSLVIAKSFAGSVIRIEISLSARRWFKSEINSSMIPQISRFVSGLNVIISSRRFKNSGRK